MEDDWPTSSRQTWNTHSLTEIKSYSKYSIPYINDRDREVITMHFNAVCSFQLSGTRLLYCDLAWYLFILLLFSRLFWCIWILIIPRYGKFHICLFYHDGFPKALLWFIVFQPNCDIQTILINQLLLHLWQGQFLIVS